MSAIDRDELLRLECLFLGAQLEIGQDNVIGQGEGHQEGSAVSRLTCLAMPSFAPVNLFAATPLLVAAALGSNCSEEACGLFGEHFRKLEVRAVPGIWVEDQPGVG